MIDDNPDKFIMIDFYMQNCHWCQVFQGEWNNLVDDFDDWFGPSVIFAKVDGPSNYYLSNHYKVNSYPSFALLDIGLSQFSSFNDDRSYASMKKWLLRKIDNKIDVLPTAKSNPYEDVMIPTKEKKEK